MRKITLEDHFSVPEMSYRLQRKFASDYAKEPDARLLDIERWRLPEMDRYGVEGQVLSFTCPRTQGIPDPPPPTTTAKRPNPTITDLVRSHPTPLTGFCALPRPD